MRFENPVPVTTIARWLAPISFGNREGMATGINRIHKSGTGDLAFVDHLSIMITCINSAASFIIINKAADVPEEGAPVVDEPFDACLRIVNHYRPFNPSMKMISDTAVIGEGTRVMPNAYIGNHVSVRKNYHLPNVTILDHCSIGDDVIIQSGTVIGSDTLL